MTFLTVWLAGIVINALLIWAMCRGEESTYKELMILGVVCLAWPMGIPITLYVWFNESGVGKRLGNALNKKAITIPGGKNK
ncbi:hypothetical protein pEaSNUABM56_00235 [Erwinia phage pEa_SNUABM_56]|uniref:Uncharacterized protein n=1 Tax=Erwinia phage pEp_SNUABM_01 TaxID=2601643 RepID=A0A5J6DBA9_9CAUD|nr:hypothetical protein HWC63_gp167 [Erwinia phage pEp_SNUABM_01]QEQ95011.1 hypothetical protein pEpSNUABM01_185 [Erwinia phage pEp_SNUABM_01]UYL84937.1 hypothetical protein pEaSNUABM55_00164 [Erwinia phage pEa_SNUABM_55]UYL85255.1 hypothetical protein pEaSNUABM56_00235 [Erwinia phage pEa_SNUABM_56]